MRKIIIATGVTLIVLVGGWIICNVSGIYKMYSIPTVANEPAIKLGSRIFASNLKEAKSGDFIIYNYNGQSRIHRVIASGGDMLEIKDGTVYVNNKDLDKNLILLHGYILTSEQAGKLSDKSLLTGPDARQAQGGTYLLYLQDAVANKNGLSAFRMISSKNEPDNYIAKTFSQPWNKDNFGPYTIPSNKLFVMGDNRDNSEDSRYLGCIDKGDIIGTVLK